MEEETKKPFYRKIPGFRSGKPWKMVVASIVYLIILIKILTPSTPKEQLPEAPETKPAATQSQQEQATPAPVQPAREKKWIMIKTWRGEGIKSTEKFEIVADEWRINWKSYGEAFKDAGIMQIFVNDDNGNMMALAANVQGPSEDMSYIHNAGRFYLDINSANIKWIVTVEEYK